MKASRVYLTMVASSLGAMALVLIIALSGYFRAVEKAETSAQSETRLLAELENFHQQLKSTEDPDEAKRIVKVLESRLGSNSIAIEKVRKSYSSVLSQYATKPKEAEARYSLVKKREFMEGLVNAYRKDIVAKNIQLCLAYLTILYDTQNSLLNESFEAEEVFLKRNRERVTNLRQLAAATQDAAVVARVGGLESSFTAFERGFDLASRWRSTYTEMLGKAEKTLPKLTKEVRAASDETQSDMRRSFLYSAILAAVVSLVALIALYVGHKLMKLRFESRAEALAKYLREFGSEKMDPSIGKSAQVLASDPDWFSVLDSARAAEADFARTYQTLLSVPKSMKLPYLVFTRDRTLIHRNESAAELFGLAEGQNKPLDELICTEWVGSSDGGTQTIIETIQNSFMVPKEDAYEILLRRGEAWVPTELISYPISYGPIAGGRIYLFREVRSEVARIDRAVAHQLTRLRDFVHKITHFYPVEIMTEEKDFEPVREALLDLGAMKMKVDERESLWKSEAEALVDQISRQREVLDRLTRELNELRKANSELNGLVDVIHGTDEDWHDEVSVMERDLTRWEENRKRIFSELAHYSSVMGKIRGFESGLREAIEIVASELRDFEATLAQLKAQGEEAKLHAVNLSFTEDASQREYAARARAHASVLNRYVETVDQLLSSVRKFVAQHPGGSLYPLLSSVDMDPGMLDSLREEQEHVHAFLQRWKGAGEKVVEHGEKAITILRDMDRKGQMATQLGETSILINEQAKGNIERWN
jgi:hypothetical protein